MEDRVVELRVDNRCLTRDGSLLTRAGLTGVTMLYLSLVARELAVVAVETRGSNRAPPSDAVDDLYLLGLGFCPGFD